MPPRRGLDKTEKIDFTHNMKYYYAAIGVIALGYLFLAIGGADSFTSLTLGPITLVAGYLVAMPIALMIDFHKKKTIPAETVPPQTPQTKIKNKV